MFFANLISFIILLMVAAYAFRFVYRGIKNRTISEKDDRISTDRMGFYHWQNHPVAFIVALGFFFIFGVIFLIVALMIVVNIYQSA